MKFTISLKQKDYLIKNGFIPLADMLSGAELDLLNKGIEKSLHVLEAKSSEKKSRFILGRDLWRLDEEVKKIVFSKRLTLLADAFLQKRPLRIAFDQLLPEKVAYRADEEYFSETASFQDYCCISGLQGLFLICIKTFPNTSEEPLPIEVGSGYFILPKTPFPFLSMTPSPHYRFLLIGYGEAFSQYLSEPKDPQNHFLKSLGYVFGDKLNVRTHPILLR